jgi:AraC family transcriptional regulator of adaptative response/methylated-DNA-[protein]-cysteine methyltransferase
VIAASQPCTVATIETPLGPLVAGAVSRGVCLLEYSTPERLESQLERMRRHLGCDTTFGDHPHLEQLRLELAAYFTRELTAFAVPLVIAGTPFQERVWRALLQIPYGETRSYEALARSIGAERGQRAVGHANGTNRLAIVVPCHRVINKSGGLGGYGGELWRKQALLKLEGRGQFLDWSA